MDNYNPYVEDRNIVASLDLKNDGDLDKIAAIGEALGSPVRLGILRELQKEPFIPSVPQLVKRLGIPTTTLLYHLEKLQKAGIINIFYKSSASGAQRFVYRNLRGANISFYYHAQNADSNSHTEMQVLGVGHFTQFTGDSFNFCTESKIYTSITDENCYTADRFSAQLIYTPLGRITYRFSNKTAKAHELSELALSMEICSEAPYFDNNYLSDITFWINGKEVCTHTLPGDFGDRRGRLNPAWWSSVNTQYGNLLSVAVRTDGAYVNGKKVGSQVTLTDLNLSEGNYIEITFGNKTTAANPGGFNLFGAKFGDHPQDICLTSTYADK